MPRRLESRSVFEFGCGQSALASSYRARCAPRAGAREALRIRKPQVGAEAELLRTANSPRLRVPGTRGRSKGRGGSQGAHMGPRMVGPK